MDIQDSEIQEHRIEEVKQPKVRPPITSKLNGNHNGARTAAGVVIYDQNQKAQNVIMKGTVFPWAEKGAFGFVASGESIQGAIETSADQAEIKCHECGGWFKNLGSHISNIHRTTGRQYRMDHRLTRQTKLAAPKTLATMRRHSHKIPTNGFQFSGKTSPNIINRRKAPAELWEAESANSRFACMAQLTVRINNLAIKLGHTPTVNDLLKGDELGKINPGMIRWAFHMTTAEAIRSIGLPAAAKSGNVIPASIQLKIIQWRAKGYSFKEISDKLGVHYQTVSKYAR